MILSLSFLAFDINFQNIHITGRSNAVNIAERLGLPLDVLDGAHKLHGTARAEINEVKLSKEFYFHASLNYKLCLLV